MSAVGPFSAQIVRALKAYGITAGSGGGTGTFTGTFKASDGSAAAPSHTFTSATDLGWYKGGTNQLAASVGGSRIFTIKSTGLTLDSSGGTVTWPLGTILNEDAANTLAQRNGTNGQIFRVYRTFTSSTNYEAIAFDFTSTGAHISTVKGSGGGSSRDLYLEAATGNAVNFVTGGTTRWQVDPNGNWLAGTDNTYDIGANGATRPRNGYFGSAINAGGNINVAGTTASAFRDNATGTKLSFPGTDGVAQFLNNVNTGFTRLILGTNDTSGIALVKNSTELQIKLGDSSAFAQFTCSALTATTKVQLSANGTLVMSATAPTISSGFGTSPSISASNGTAAFTITVGTGGTDTSGVITLPTASTGWIVFAQDMTTPGVNATKQTASSTTSATLTNYNTTTGVAAAWTAGDVIRCIAVAY